MSKKVLILTGSYGSGHNTAAESLQSAYSSNGYITTVVDLAEYYKKTIGKTTKKFYEVSSSEFPKVWEFTYDLMDSIKIKDLFYSFSYPYFQNKFNKLIERENPQVIIIVFPFWSLFLRNYLLQYPKTFSTGIFITDAIKIQAVWHMGEEGIDYYFFIDDASKEIFRQRFTHTKANLKTVFFPLSSEYFIERSKINSKHILIILSSLKKDFVDNFLSILKDSSKTLTIVQGRNPQLYKKMYQKYSHISQFHFFEYLSLKDYYKEVDICVSKPGGATISECIASEIPLLIPDFIPGQEEGNKILIEKNEIGIYEANPLKAVFLLNYIDWSKMLPNFKKIKNPHACEDIIKYLS